jgi:DNA-directed RNA polymerase subunit RPC12/RpoP
MRFINLCTVDNSYEANFIKEDLADQGIPCIVTNENFTNLMPHLNGVLGSGIQVLVDRGDFEAAREILEKRRKKDIVTCPECGSRNIKYGLGPTLKTSKILALILSLIIAAPTRHIRQTYYCNDCKHEFGNT